MVDTRLNRYPVDIAPRQAGHVPSAESGRLTVAIITFGPLVTRVTVLSRYLTTCTTLAVVIVQIPRYTRAWSHNKCNSTAATRSVKRSMPHSKHCEVPESFPADHGRWRENMVPYYLDKREAGSRCALHRTGV